MKKNALHFIASIPWAIENDSLSQIIEIGQRLHEKPEELESKFELLAGDTGQPLEDTRYTTIKDGVATINIVGPIFRYANLFTELSGATSTAGLIKDFTTAVEDPEVNHIVLNLDTPGGQATSISELAATIKNSTKPTVAYVDGMAASAGYWIASACDKVVISETGEVGSIGAVYGVDTKEREGHVKIISSQSPLKQAKPTTTAGKAELQRRIDALAQIFIEAVADNRGVTPEKVVKDFGRGGIRIGADAVKTGMADEVGTYEEVIAGLVSGNQHKSAKKGVVEMADKNTPSKPEMSVETLRTDYPDIAQALFNEGKEAGLKEGAGNERARIQAVKAQLIPGHEELIDSLMWDGETTGPEAAVKVVNAENAKRADVAKTLAEEAPEAMDEPAAVEEAPEKVDMSTEEGAKKAWEVNHEECQEEFMCFEDFWAFHKNDPAFQVKMSRGE